MPQDTAKNKQIQYNTNLIKYLKTQWGSEPATAVAHQIGQGHRLPTEALSLSPNAKYRAEVVQAGALDHLLAFLNKTNEPFANILPAPDDPSITHPILVPCPSIWLNVLNNFCQKGFLQPESLANEIQNKITKNLVPLLDEMSNIHKRELFGSKDSWIKSLMFFTNILSSLATTNHKPNIDFLLSQEGFMPFLVQVVYIEIAEPDLVKSMDDFSRNRDDRMPKPDVVGLAQSFAACTIKALMVNRGGKGPLVEAFAGTRIGPESNLVLMHGLFELLHTSKRDGWYQGGYSAVLSIFIILFDKAERLSGPFKIDSASENLVKIARQHMLLHGPFQRDRFFLENIMTGIVTIMASLVTPFFKGKQAPVDYSVAKAIDAGIFDYMLEVCDANDLRLAKPLDGLIRLVSSTAILEDSQKALQRQSVTIRAKLERIKERHPILLQSVALIEEIFKNPVVKPPPEEESCAFCQESVGPETIQKCPFCKLVVYCSKDCQRLNWMIHQSECPHKRKDPVAPSQQKLMDDGKRIFSKHVTQILLQSALKGVSILDCIVVLDMCEITPLLMTYTLDQYVAKYIQDEDARTMSEKVMARNKEKGALTVSFVGFSNTDGFNGNLLTFPPDTAPRTPNVMKADKANKWLIAQKEVAQKSLGQGGGAQMQRNPQMWKAALMKTMKP